MITSPAWMDHAACRSEDPRLFFPPDGERQPERERREDAAKAVCACCPVQAPCLARSLGRHGGRIEVGLWGGMGDEERQNVKRNLMRRGEFTAA